MHTLELPHAARLRAATALIGSMSNLSARGTQVVQHVVGDAVLSEWDHYPDQDVRDNASASQYYFHAHESEKRPVQEHGHFHVFVHPDTLGLTRRNPKYPPGPAHIVAISMDAQGLPTGFFATNRWVTKGPWLNYAACEKGLTAFVIKGRRGERDINMFLRALLTLYHGHILLLLQQRDAVMRELCAERDRRSVFADTGIEVLCYLPIHLSDDIAALESAA
ncbi:hypothetical protein [Polaromonas sp.]|uniref:DUF6969 family protein n=1 Tax=Polaromonas sp. TaxID=1869339 RepID=UPI003564B06E